MSEEIQQDQEIRQNLSVKMNQQATYGAGVGFEHIERACCRVVGDKKTFPKALRAEVQDRVIHD